MIAEIGTPSMGIKGHGFASLAKTCRNAYWMQQMRHSSNIEMIMRCVSISVCEHKVSAAPAMKM